MPNGMINANRVKSMIEREFHTFIDGAVELNATVLREMLDGIASKIYASAWKNIDEVALGVVRADVVETNDIMRLRRIQCIKLIREQTGCGLREAKDAFETAVPKVARELAEIALYNLASVNRTVCYSNVQMVPGENYTNVLSGVEIMPGHIPF